MARRGLDKRETFVPQSYALGHEAQVDWHEAWIDFAGERTKVQVFAMRSMASGAAFHRGYLHATQQAFLEAHEHAFAYFGGVFHLLRYDNLASAVRKILRGQRREETTRFIAFRSHWRFAAEFCTPGEGHEKGGVKGEGGYFRRNHLVPVPDVADLDALNALLLSGCREDEARVLDGRTQPIGAAIAEERSHLLPCATDGFDLAEVIFALVDKQGCVTVKTSFYSVPIRAGSRVEVRIRPLHVEVWHTGRLIARHERCHRRRQHVLDLEHYLDVLSHKPGAFAGSKPLAQWREAGRWPAPWYSSLAILTALTFRAVFRLALRQTEDLIGSVIGLLGLDLAVPDHSTLCRRAETLEVPRPKPRRDDDPLHLLVDSTGLKLCGAGEWLVEKHGTKTRRSWRKLHIGLDANSGQIVASALTAKEVDDGAEVGPLLDQVAAGVASFTADGAYDQEGASTAVAERHPEAAIIVPPRSTAVPSEAAETAPTQRDRHLQFIAEHGRAAWQKASGYTQRSRAEAAIGRFKQVIGDGLRSRTGERRATEVDVAVHALNRMLELGRPISVRIA